MDAVVWLLRHGVIPTSIHWVVPRDSWLQNRLNTQPGLEFFNDSIGAEADKIEALANSPSIDALFLKLEACGQMLRIDPTQTPTMFHYATVSTGEVALLRLVTNVIRRGRVRAIEPGALVFDQGRHAMSPGTLFVDCTASAVEPRENQPVFAGDGITVQLLRVPLVVQSAAVTAYVEIHGGDEEQKNQLCTPAPFPQTLAGYARATQVSMMNQFHWSRDAELRQWLRQSRLDGFGKMVADIKKDDAARQAILARLRCHMTGAMANLSVLTASAEAPVADGRVH